MAPLYSRYVPPKPPAISTAPSTSVSRAPAQASPDAEHKRKRERTDDEKEERKAKKLRKKEQRGDGPNASLAPTVDEVPAEVAAPSTSRVDAPGVSEFAHIKNVKKRHKLEREARNARKEAKKAVGEVQEDTPGAASTRASGALENGPDQPVNTTTAVAQALETVPTASDKYSKREKRRKQQQEDVPATTETQSVLSTHIADDTPTENRPQSPEVVNGDATVPRKQPLAQSKKRRHTLEAVLAQRNEADDDAGANSENDDEHLRNYGSIMSKFQKSREKAEKRGNDETAAEPPVAAEPVVEKRDLVPFPQPANEPQAPFKPTFSALPSWLSAPSTISNDSKATFADLKLPTAIVQRISKLGFSDALPVQQALIPLLLPPGTSGATFSSAMESVVPDVAVSAATGSGKTIAYLLPMIESLKQSASSLDRLRVVVVVPTRELVSQVAAVAEDLTRGTGLKVGNASGAGKFKDEQQRLVKMGKRYDPAAYRALMAKAHRRDYPPPLDSDDFAGFVEHMEQWNDRLEQEVQDAVTGLVDHAPTYDSAVDILVCTPGRLLEHMNSTLGFTLSFVEWLILDEADKLLDQQYDGLLQRLDEELSRPRTPAEQDPRERLLRSQGVWDERFERRVRKVVLSATMTRDISKLTTLKLRRPEMIVVQGGEETDAAAGADALVLPESENGVFELPRTLKEYCVPVGDGTEKPLHLLELLSTRMLTDLTQSAAPGKADVVDEDDTDSSDSEVSSDSSSDKPDSDSEATSSDSSSDSASDPDSDSDNSTSTTSVTPPNPTPTKPTTPSAPTILIFTSSTESTTRLTHLLRSLRPQWSPYLTSLTKTSSRPKNQPTPSSSPQIPIITVSTDRTSRGLDTLSGRPITHVIQYDVPRSLTSYVHRVGRTARAGRGGEAWTLYEGRQARWFVNSVMRAGGVRRAGEVERVRVGAGGEEERRKLVEGVAGMRGVVYGAGK